MEDIETAVKEYVKKYVNKKLEKIEYEMVKIMKVMIEIEKKEPEITERFLESFLIKNKMYYKEDDDEDEDNLTDYFKETRGFVKERLTKYIEELETSKKNC